MRTVTVKTPFVWRAGHSNVLIESGQRKLSEAQYLHAQRHGYLATPKPTSEKSTHD